MPKSLPTQRTLARLRQEGALEVAIVEHWNPHARIRQDLFGFIDILAIMPGGLLAIQACAGTDTAKRLSKIKTQRRDAARHWLGTGARLEVWGWRQLLAKRGGKQKVWAPSIRVVTIEDLVGEDEQS